MTIWALYIYVVISETIKKKIVMCNITYNILSKLKVLHESHVVEIKHLQQAIFFSFFR